MFDSIAPSMLAEGLSPISLIHAHRKMGSLDDPSSTVKVPLKTLEFLQLISIQRPFSRKVV